MKNFTLLLAAILSLSVANAQNVHQPVFGDKLTMPAITDKIYLPGEITAQDKSISERSAIQSRSLIPIYDSIYFWQSNPYTQLLELNNKQIDFIYNGNNFTSFIDQSWSGSAWSNNYQQAYTFNSDNDLTNLLQQTWTGSAWVNQGRITFIYNSNNLQTTNLQQTWSGSAWVNNSQDTFTYNTGGYGLTLVVKNWSGSAWVNYSKDTLFYNSNNLETLDLFQLWSGSAWVNNGKDTSLYNSNNVMTGDVFQTWSGSAWVNSSQDIYTYNSNNDETVDLYQTWFNNSWVNGELSTYNYDGNNIEISGTDTDYSVTGDTIVGSDSSHYYFTKTAEGINQLSANNEQLSVYPNPSSDFIHTIIQLNQPSILQLRLVNMLGQTVWGVDAGNVSSYQNNISVANLPDGVYLLEMVTENGTAAKEVVVAR